MDDVLILLHQAFSLNFQCLDLKRFPTSCWSCWLLLTSGWQWTHPILCICLSTLPGSTGQALLPFCTLVGVEVGTVSTVGLFVDWRLPALLPRCVPWGLSVNHGSFELLREYSTEAACGGRVSLSLQLSARQSRKGAANYSRYSCKCLGL